MLLLEGSVRVQVIGEGGREVLYRVLPGQSCVLTTCCILSGDDYLAEGFTETPVRAVVVTKPAVELGTAREVVSRHLKRLEASGLVELGRSTVIVRDPPGLQRLTDTPL